MFFWSLSLLDLTTEHCPVWQDEVLNGVQQYKNVTKIPSEFSGMTSTLTSTEQCLSCTAKSTQPSSWVCQSKPPRRNSKSQRSPSPQQIPESQQGAVWSQVLILRTNFIRFHVKSVTLLLVLLIWTKCITFLMCFRVSHKWGRLRDDQSMCGLWMGWDRMGGGYLYKNILCPSFW